MIRKDESDLVYQTELSKWKAVLNQTKICYEKQQPILIGTSSVEKSEFLSDLFKVSNIPHEILNAKPENLLRENEIVAQAGKPGAVTIATNMAGRGTDIILGGNPTFQTKQLLIDIFLNKTIPIKVDPNLQTLIENTTNEYEEKNIKFLKRDIENLPYSLDIDSTFESLRNLYNFLYKEVVKNWKEKNREVIKLSKVE